jgi:AcrR family transcriptional regulator
MSGYTSERRQRQAQATRRDIVRAARRLFARQGYAATSMTDIARTDGVAVQTIYASCGSKRDLVLALVDAIDEEADVASISEQAARSERADEILALGVHLTRQLHERCGDIIAALLSAAAVEPDASAAAAEGRRRHREGCARAARRLAKLKALRDDVTADQAAALIATLTWQPTYAQLTSEHGWSLDDCEKWITTTLTRTLLR